MKPINDKRIRIPFHLHPYQFEKNCHAVEKDDGKGRKRRYLLGVSSGMKVDGHGERMTKACVENMHLQAKSSTVPLFVGQHGVNHSDDIGVLTDSEVMKDGDWVTTYRLYDELDGFNPGCQTIERAEKLWRQVNGLKPYDRPLQKGFSIEGYIPENGIISMSETGQRVVDRVDLDGVLVTPRPSYKSSVITAVYKALDELTPQKRIDISENIRGKFINTIETEQEKQNYYSKRFKLEDALYETIEEIMQRGVEVRDRLNLLLDEYKMMLIELIIDSARVFVRPANEPDIPDMTGEVDVAKSQARMRLLKSIEGALVGYFSVMKSKKDRVKEKAHKKIQKGDKKNGRYDTKRASAGRKTDN